jgi:hypothetical protein
MLTVPIAEKVSCRRTPPEISKTTLWLELLVTLSVKALECRAISEPAARIAAAFKKLRFEESTVSIGLASLTVRHQYYSTER